METAANLYQAILARHSVRRYARQALDAQTLAQVEAIISGVKALVRENRFEVLVRDVAPGEDLAQAMGAYGRIVSPPRYLLPYGVGKVHLLTDLGYRVEQIAVRLAGLGIGSCYIGSLGREGEVRARFGLPEDTRIGAFLIFGYAATSLAGRAFNALAHRAAGAASKLPAERITYTERFDRPVAPPVPLVPLIEAARHAPSALNAQPWRFLWRNEALYLFVQRYNRRYGRGPGAEYALFDGGICMGNVALALEALERPGRWQLLADGAPNVPDHPADLRPLAKLLLG